MNIGITTCKVTQIGLGIMYHNYVTTVCITLCTMLLYCGYVMDKLYTLLQSLSHIHEMVVQIDTEANMCDNLSSLAYTTNSSYSLTIIYC